VDQTVYHVLLEGRTVGPYDRRTIVGMRVKKTLTSSHVLIGADGTQLTVADLIGRKPARPFNSDRTNSYSVVQAAYPAWLLQARGRGIDIPPFKGEIEARIQAEGVLRLAGRFRRGFRWKEGRVKIPLKDVVHTRVKGTQVELWLRGGEGKQQQIALELFTPEVAKELLHWLPAATPLPASGPAAQVRAGGVALAAPQALWMAALSVLSVAMVVGVVLVVVLYRGGR
jgi:hypothetical protein